MLWPSCSVKMLFDVPWFSVAYCLLLLLSPWLNIIARSISTRSYRIFLALTFVFFSIVPAFTESSFTSSPLGWLCYLYLAASYIRLHGFKVSKGILAVLMVCSAFVVVAGLSIPCLLDKGIGSSLHALFSARNSPFVFVFSLCVFESFRRINLGCNSFVNGVASLAFGVYLVSDNPFVRVSLWPHFSGLWSASPVLLLASALGITVSVYAVCAFLEYTRRKVALIVAGSPAFKEILSSPEDFYARIDSLFSIGDLGDSHER